MTTGPVHYDRAALVETLIYHQRAADSGCHCGWGRRPEHLGRSWAEHVVDVYEQSVLARVESNPNPPLGWCDSLAHNGREHHRVGDACRFWRPATDSYGRPVCAVTLGHRTALATWRSRRSPSLTVCDRHRGHYDERPELGPYDWEPIR